MLFQLGTRPASTDLVDLLRACHERIRRFTQLAARLAAAHEPPAAEVADLAGQIRRYFTISFPLHVADEDEHLAPRLAGQSAEVDAALARMHAEHGAHAAPVARLVALCDDLVREPSHLAARAAELAAVAAELDAAFAPHLALEERVVFPALAQLPAADRAALRDALRERREAPGSPGQA